jgi:arylsulfatase A-like enzyme
MIDAKDCRRAAFPASAPGGWRVRRARRRAVQLLALGALACAPEPTGPSFVVVSVDTLRADHLGAYGYARDTSPQIDRFAARSRRYANAWAPAPWTLPSHAALLTGRDPLELGIADLRSALPDGVSTLAEWLGRAGYATAAFVDSRPRGFVGAERGFARGFDAFVHEPRRPGTAFRDDMAATVDAALEWLDARDRSRPFLLFLHTKSVHAKRTHGWALDPAAVAETDVPYEKPEPWRSRFLPGGRTRYAWHDPADPAVSGARYLERLNEQLAAGRLASADVEAARIEELVALYDAGIAYVDEHFGRLLAGLAQRGLDRSTVVVLTADHGESFLERRLFLHVQLGPETLRVPLIVHDPRDPAGTVIETPVALADVAPTLVARAGLPVPPGLSGAELPAADGAPRPAAASLSYYHLVDGYLYEGFALRDGPWQLRLERWRGEAEPRVALFDLRADPDERTPVVDDPERLRAMRADLEARLAARAGAPTRSIELGAETREELRALGYATE